MVYEIAFTKKAQEQLLKLDLDFQKRILNVLERVKFDPFYYAKRLVGTDYYRFRVGDYRLIVEINQNQLIIIVIEIGKRQNIYK